jgi:hypothetical protein
LKKGLPAAITRAALLTIAMARPQCRNTPLAGRKQRGEHGEAARLTADPFRPSEGTSGYEKQEKSSALPLCVTLPRTYCLPRSRIVRSSGSRCGMGFW